MLAASCVSTAAIAAPAPGERLPAFVAHDIAGGEHDSRSLEGRRTMIVALTDRAASGGAQAWWAAANRHVGRDVHRVTIVSLRFPPLSNGLARDRARAHTPRHDWVDTWLDGNRRMAHVLELPKSTTPFVFALDERGRVVAAAHASPNSQEANAIWRALGR